MTPGNTTPAGARHPVDADGEVQRSGTTEHNSSPDLAALRELLAVRMARAMKHAEGYTDPELDGWIERQPDLWAVLLSTMRPAAKLALSIAEENERMMGEIARLSHARDLWMGFDALRTRERDDARAEAAALRSALEGLQGAISWLQPPFVDDKTDVAEIRKRIRFMLDDAARALATEEGSRTGSITTGSSSAATEPKDHPHAD